MPRRSCAAQACRIGSSAAESMQLRPMLVAEQQSGHRKRVLLLYESFNNTGFLPNDKTLDRNVNRP